MRRSSTTLVLICALLLADCATERLGTVAPAGVNLTGEWKFNPNLSDDPNNLVDPDKAPLQQTPRRHRGRTGPGGGTGEPPMGSPGSGGYNFQPTVLPIKAPQHLSITQNGANLVIKIELPDGTQKTDEYVAGAATTVPYGKDNTAEQSVGWRGPVFVVTTNVKKGGHREDDFALDDSGHLIISTQAKNNRGRDVEVKRVYDRVRGVQS